MFARMAAAWCLAACVASAAGGGEWEQGALCVTLASCKEEYVVGEPVLLVLTARNITGEDVKGLTVFLDVGEPEIRLYISRDGEKFRRYKIGDFIHPAEVGRDLNVLPPGQAWQYRLRMLYARHEPSRLAFPEAGHYWVKAVYPLMGRRPSEPLRRKRFDQSGRDEYESNAVEIVVRHPAGVDATVWQTVQEPAFLRFLQRHCGAEDPAVTREAASGVSERAMALLETVPHSSYHDAIRYSLRDLYDGRRDRIKYLTSQKDRQLSHIRSALGIEELPPGPFPEDARLDAIVTYEFPQGTPLTFALDELSRQARVPLSADPKFASQNFVSLKATRSVRDFMLSRSGWGKKWEPYGDGYRLVPAPFAPPPPGLPGGAKQK